MTLAARRQTTYKDLLALPEHLVGEIVGGELVVSPRPAMQYAGGVTALGATIVVPDLAGWRVDRMPAPPSETFMTLAPDWVCEVLSPSTGRHDRTKKLPIYARASVAHLWLIDPLAQTLEVYRLDAGFWLLLATHGGDDPVRAEPFEAAVVELSRLWGRI